MASGNISEIIFEVSEDEVDGGYSASALGYGIHTEGETLEELRRNVKEAVDCYFDDAMKRPGVIRESESRSDLKSLARATCRRTHPDGQRAP